MPSKPSRRTGRRHADHGSVNGAHMVSFQASEEMTDRLNRMADDQALSRSEIIRVAVDMHLKALGY